MIGTGRFFRNDPRLRAVYSQKYEVPSRDVQETLRANLCRTVGLEFGIINADAYLHFGANAYLMLRNYTQLGSKKPRTIELTDRAAGIPEVAKEVERVLGGR